MVEEIAQKLDIAVAELILHYAKWFFAASIGWILFGCLFIFIGFLVFRWLWNCKEEDYDREAARIVAVAILVVATLIGFIIIGSHIGDFVAPEGIAYHQLISDIRGN